jgi:predicted transcriptional regulator
MYVSKIVTKYTNHYNTFLNSTLHSYDFYLITKSKTYKHEMDQIIPNLLS